TAMSDAVDMKGPAKRARNQGLDSVMRFLAVQCQRGQSEPTKNSEDMRVHGKDVSAQREHQHAPGRLDAYAWQINQKGFGFRMRHFLEQAKGDRTESGLDRLKNKNDVFRFLSA